MENPATAANGRKQTVLYQDNFDQGLSQWVGEQTPGGRIQYSRDGEVVFEFRDKDPFREGWFGFRTVRNHLRIDNFRVYQSE